LYQGSIQVSQTNTLSNEPRKAGAKLRETARAALGVVDDPSFDLHHSVGYHPERPERLVAARAALKSAAVETRSVQVRPATREQLGRVHGPGYLERLSFLAGKEGQLDADTYFAPESVAAAERAAGGGVSLIDAMLEGDVLRGVALLRPPGHHARPEEAMGFCLLNNVAVAAAQALSHGLSRVAIIDWDVHHGNGTQEMFWRDPRVLYLSLHQWPFYPGSGSAGEIGEGEGRGFTVNVPLSAGARAGDYAAAFDRIVLPVLESYAPELVLVSAGFDAHRDDPLANMQLDASTYRWMTAKLLDVAERTAGGKMALFLEGGYHLPALEASLSSCLEVLSKGTSGIERPPAPQTVQEMEIKRAKKALERFWPGVV